MPTFPLTFELAEPTPLLNETLRMHHRVRTRYRHKLAWEIRTATAGHRPTEPLRRARVTVHRHSTGTPDRDGLYGGCKTLIDCLTTPRVERNKRTGEPIVRNPSGLAFILDDNPNVLELVVHAVRCARAEQRTVVTIEDLGGLAP